MQSRRLARRQEEAEADRVARQFLHTMTAAVQWRGAPELPWELQEGVARGERGGGVRNGKAGLEDTVRKWRRKWTWMCLQIG